MSWKVFFFTTNRNEKPVKEFIKLLSPSSIAKIAHTIDLLKQYGPLLNMPHSKKVAHNLYELRIRGKQEIRIFYIFKEKDIYLLHAFQKKSQKTPSKELKIALTRIRLLI
ncbi:MAG: type II toxin-antitoxin system RelE/ParE family toxin [Patescibacteria group bacterium]|nr:type II toxin-antitoxin system RelE/ParE family toxin [Patescibacteria group bacterium]